MREGLEELGLRKDDLDWITLKSKLTFKNLVKKQSQELALLKLLDKKNGHTKMINLEYTSI